MRDYLLAFLQALEAKIPPGETYPHPKHHSITCARYGSDETGWRDELVVHVWHDGKVQTVQNAVDALPSEPEVRIREGMGLSENLIVTGDRADDQ